MKKVLITISIILFSFFSVINHSFAENRQRGGNSQFMSVDEIKPGQTGVCLTVLKGERIEQIKIKVLGVLKNIFSDTGSDEIVVRLYHPKLNGMAILSGMSGSPVYINGRLIGAVAYADDFGKEPVGFLTPIKDIIGMRSSGQAAFLFDQNNGKLRNPMLFSARGFNSSAISFLNSHGDNFRFKLMPMSSGKSSNSVSAPISITATDIAPGSMVGVQLMRGDLDIAALGTVAYRDDQFLYLFGHPFTGVGRVELPLTRANVIGIYPSYCDPYKITNDDDLIGTVTFDGKYGLFAELGRRPKMVPVTIIVNNHTYYVEIARHNALLPSLLKAAIINLILKERQFDDVSIRMVQSIRIKGFQRDINVDRFLSGKYEDVLDHISSELRAIDVLVNNVFSETEIESANFNIEILPERREAKILSISSDKDFVSPGSSFKLSLDLYRYNDGLITKEISVNLPKDTEDDLPKKASIDLKIILANNIDLGEEEKRPEPKSLDGLIEQVERHSGLYIILSGPRFADRITLNYNGTPINKIDLSKFGNYNDNVAVFQLDFEELKNLSVVGSKSVIVTINN